MGNDSLRVGDRAVPLAEIEARYIAHRDALNAHADSDATQAEHAAYRLGLSAIHDIPALLTEVRRLRAVESAGTLVAVELCACGFIRSLHGSNNILPHAFTLKETYYTRTWTVPAAAPPETGG